MKVMAKLGMQVIMARVRDVKCTSSSDHLIPSHFCLHAQDVDDGLVLWFSCFSRRNTEFSRAFVDKDSQHVFQERLWGWGGSR